MKAFSLVLEVPKGYNQFFAISANVRWCSLYLYEPGLSAVVCSDDKE